MRVACTLLARRWPEHLRGVKEWSERPNEGQWASKCAVPLVYEFDWQGTLTVCVTGLHDASIIL